MKRIISILIIALLIFATCFVYINLDKWTASWYSEEKIDINGILESSNINLSENTKILTDEAGEIINTAIKYKHSNISLINNLDDLTFDQEILDFYKTVWLELSNIDNIVISKDMDLFLSFKNELNETFYLKTTCTFSFDEEMDPQVATPKSYINTAELESVYIYLPNATGQVELDIIKTNTEKTLIYNRILYFTDRLTESSFDTASLYVSINGERKCIDLSEYQYEVLANDTLEKISVNHSKDIIKLSSSIITDIFTIEYPIKEDSSVQLGYEFNEDNFKKLYNEEYPDFDNNFSQKNPISRILFNLSDEYYGTDMNQDHLGVTMNYTDATTMEDIKFMLIIGINAAWYVGDNPDTITVEQYWTDPTRLAEQDDITSLYLYEFRNNEWVKVKSYYKSDTVQEMSDLSNCIYGTGSSDLYDCYAFDESSKFGNETLEISQSFALLEHDLPGYLFDYIIEPIN